MTDPNDAILDTNETAEYLKVPRRTLESWRSQGLGPTFIRLTHGKVKYRLSDLIKFLAEKTVVPRRNRAA